MRFSASRVDCGYSESSAERKWTLDPDLAHEFVDVAHALADAAIAETLSRFREPDLKAENKAIHSWDPVTEADRKAERAMREILAKRRPDDSILGEEEAYFSGSSEFVWVLDPIDGTRGYVSGTPTWGTLVAVSDSSGPLFGIIDQPYIGERFEGGLGRSFSSGPFGMSKSIVRKDRSMPEATITTTMPEVGTPRERAAFENLASRTRIARYGMDCYGYALLACGHLDLVVEAGLKPVDVHAPIAVVRAAGGIVTDWNGGSPHDGGRVLAAATPELHKAALQVLSQA